MLFLFFFAGVCEDDDGFVLSIVGVFFGCVVFEVVACGVLIGYVEDEVLVDWCEWRARFGGGAVVVGGCVVICLLWDFVLDVGMVDVVVEWCGSAFGSGLHLMT